MEENKHISKELQLDGVRLTQSFFKVNKGAGSGGEVNLNVMVRVDEVEIGFKTSLIVQFTPSGDGDSTLEGVFVMEGLFKVLIDNGEIDLREFKYVGAPSIIYPFMREHIVNLSMKALINPIFLPPFNFKSMYEDKLNEGKIPEEIE